MKSSCDKKSKPLSFWKVFLLTLLPFGVAAVIASVVLIIFAVSGLFGGFTLTRGTLWGILAAPLAGILTSLIASYVYYLRAHRTRKKLTETLRNIDSGNYDIDVPDNEDLAVYGNLKNISYTLAAYKAHTEHLENRCEDLEKDYNDAVMRFLNAKVNPVMTRTVIAGVSKMAHEDRCNDILELLDNAQSVLDSYLEDGSKPVSLTDELSRIKRYIEIYELITGEKINYRMSIMCNIVDYRIIPNIVLPIVQDIFDVYSAEHPSTYEIGVEVTSSTDNLLVIIRDNCINSQTGHLNLSEDDISPSNFDYRLEGNDSGISVASINYRLRSFYGEKYGLKFSKSSLGTVAYLYLPPQEIDLDA